ncbi:hypothetical protein MPSI1_001191 [Malassezia psittaci]|uniref:Uncharacterized protein n=1 Tax=Malassezia psittaci TaxID=1821823 RepID=A0AAF0F831_9BASI|nr:hypothetical protein MPSI1_001191 [Malassezia psittaci]
MSTSAIDTEYLETDSTGAEVRYEVFEKAWHRARTQLQELADGLYEPYCGQIAEKLSRLRMGIPTLSVDGMLESADA